MNPCPCGYFGHPTHPCLCSPKTVDRYLGKVSGPLLDRIDLHIEVPAVPFEELSSRGKEETSAQIRERVNRARKLQHQRYQGLPYACNAHIPAAQLQEMCPATQAASQLLQRAFESFGFSARTYGRVLKVARTIADLEGCEVIDTAHVAEAVQLTGPWTENTGCKNKTARKSRPTLAGAGGFSQSPPAFQRRRSYWMASLGNTKP